MSFMDIFKKNKPDIKEFSNKGDNVNKNQEEVDASQVTYISLSPAPRTTSTPRVYVPGKETPTVKQVRKVEPDTYKPYYSPGFESLDQTSVNGGNPFQKVTYVAPKRNEKKNVIVFVVENSAIVSQYAKQIERIMSKIINDKKTSLFLFLQTGNGSKNYPIMDYDDAEKSNMPKELLKAIEGNDAVKLLSTFFYITSYLDKFFSANHEHSKTYQFKKCNYDIESVSIICIGSGKFDMNDFVKKMVMDYIKDFKSSPKIKGFKYFCIKDTDTVKVAALGFPVIGHITSNFYE